MTKPFKSIPVATERHNVRRRINPTTCEPNYSADEIEFMKAMDQYKRDNCRPFPTWSEVLEVLGVLGYRRVAEPSMVSALSTTPALRMSRAKLNDLVHV